MEVLGQLGSSQGRSESTLLPIQFGIMTKGRYKSKRISNFESNVMVVS